MAEHILVTGGTGFIGRQFCKRALAEGLHLHVLTRNKAAAEKLVPDAVHLYGSLDELPDELGFSTLLNLAGEPLADKRWNTERKRQFYQSRIGMTQALYAHFVQRGSAPNLLINGSAIGYYGPHTDKKLDESGTSHESFSHQLCADWERQARQFQALGTRVCYLRIGIVLGPGEGALARMVPVFKLGLGGPIGRGSQWMSWIHIDDLIELIFHCMERSDLSGAVNATAPHPVRNKRFSKLLGGALHRPAFFAMPVFAAELMFGEMARELLLSGQHVVPRKALETGFEYRFPELSEALQDIVSS